MPVPRIPRPAAEEHIDYFARYVVRVPGEDAGPALATQLDATLAALRGLTDADALRRYAPGKWSVKQVLGHVADCERVFAYRALRIARGDRTPLAGFDENAFVAGARFDALPLAALVDELRVVRAATLSLFGALDEAECARVGTSNEHPISVRALGWIIAGHELHHREGLRERYGVGA